MLGVCSQQKAGTKRMRATVFEQDPDLRHADRMNEERCKPVAGRDGGRHEFIAAARVTGCRHLPR